MPVRLEMARVVRELFSHLLATVNSPGQMGTLANWNQKLLPDVFLDADKELAAFLGESLPAEAQFEKTYRGPTRIILPAVQTSAAWNEDLNLRIIILSESPPAQTELLWRPLGEGDFVPAPVTLVNRGVYSATIPSHAQPGVDLEYYVRVLPSAGEPVHFPPTAPAINQTVVRVTTAPAPRLSAVQRLGPDRWQFHLRGVPRNVYVIEASTDLRDWQSLDTTRANPEGDAWFERTAPAEEPLRFYRVRHR